MAVSRVEVAPEAEGPNGMRIAVLIWAGASFGGAERRFARLAEELSRRPGMGVTLFCLARSLPALESIGIDPDKMEIRTIDLPGGENRGGVFRAAALLNFIVKVATGRFDRLFLAMNPGLLTYLVTRFRPFLPRTSMAMVDLLHATHAHARERFLVRRSVGRAYSVDCLSDGVLEAFDQSIDARDRHKIRIAPGSFTDYQRAAIASDRDIDVAIIGRLTPFKGHELLEKAAARLGNIELHVCGGGPMSVTIPGAKVYQTDDPFGVLGRTKISLSLQKFGNYPSQVVLESMASKCAIIATDTGETRKFLDEDCAVLIPYDADALADAIKRLLNEPERRHALAEEAHRRVLRDHTVARYADYFVRDVLA